MHGGPSASPAASHLSALSSQSILDQSCYQLGVDSISAEPPVLMPYVVSGRAPSGPPLMSFNHFFASRTWTVHRRLPSFFDYSPVVSAVFDLQLLGCTPIRPFQSFDDDPSNAIFHSDVPLFAQWRLLRLNDTLPEYAHANYMLFGTSPL